MSTPPLPKELELLFNLFDFIKDLTEKSTENNRDILSILIYLMLGLIAMAVVQTIVNRQRLSFFNDPQGNKEDLNIHEQRLVSANFPLNKIPEDFICPISLSIMVDPVILVPVNFNPHDLNTKKSFDKASIDAHMDKAKERGDSDFICPTTRIKFSGYLLNGSLKSIIDEWVSKKVAKSTFNEAETVTPKV
ncbi:U-box domain protein [Legionella nautarum]|uniref:U-box domain protein n=1 Tax=Legionella nautarum TaxID=45070 RepID=A0A0W0WU21_9GAMM|nr:U-box domain-containing protein [Legionella nautarum]KTD35820.1 U-box domain protein [Legionella nautarum]